MARRFASYLALMRLPNVFTAMADVAMGFLFVQATGSKWTPTPWDFATLATLIAASSLLYIAGMVLNDVFDVEIDRQERPERPIPSGRVSFDAARRLGWRLLFLGVALARARSSSPAICGPAWWPRCWPRPSCSTTPG